MIEVERLHPLVIVGAKLGLLFCVLPLVRVLVRVAIGKERSSRLERDYPAVHAYVTMTGAMLAGAHLGWDILDPRLFGITAATSHALRLLAGVALAVVAAIPSLLTIRERWPGAALDAAFRSTVVFALVAALVPYALLIGVRRVTVLPDDPLSRDALARAPWRSVIVPSDPNARIGIAQRRAFADDLDAARLELEYARALRVEAAPAFEVESEIAARMGDCRAAEALFHHSLEARLPSDLEAFASTRLDLGRYHLPPSLVTRCNYGADRTRR